MDSKSTTSAKGTRNRDASKPPNPGKPAAKVVKISTATVFKKRKLDTPQHSIVRNFNRKTRVEEAHPLALVFKETSIAYRRHLYSKAVTTINKDLDTLLNKLYESNVQVVSSDPVNNKSQVSPLKLTVPAKYQRLVRTLCNPLSGHRHLLQQANAMGEIERVQITVYDRFQSFEEAIQVETEEIKNLQCHWEGVVGEIFRLGVACLGARSIVALLSTIELDSNDTESALFAPQYGSSANRGEAKGKCVSFAGPNMATLFPGFLFNTPGQQKLIPVIPDLPTEEIQQVEQAIAELGKQHMREMQRLENEHQAWWKKKQSQLAQTFMQD